MKGVLGAVLTGYEYIGFFVRTIFLFFIKGIILGVGGILFLVIGRKDLLEFATEYNPQEVPLSLHNTIDMFLLSSRDKKLGEITDERLVNGISLSFIFGLSVAIYIIVVFNRDFSLVGGLISFPLIAIITGLIFQIPHGVLHSLRVMLEDRDLRKKLRR